MAETELIDHHQLSRTLRYWQLWCLRRVRLGDGMIYNQAVGSLNHEHEQIPPLYSPSVERGSEIEEDRLSVGLDDTLSLKDFWSTKHKQPEAAIRRSGFSPRAIRWINRFDWLADMRAFAESSDDEKNRDKKLNFKDKNETCIATLENWIRSHPCWSPLAWHVPTLAQRINNWLYFYKEFFGSGINTAFDGVFFSSISKQLDHLHNSVLHETTGFERILSLVCWVNTGLCISSEEKRLSEGVALLSIELRALLKSPNHELLSSPRMVHETHHLLYYISKGFLRQRLSVPPEIARALKHVEALLRQYRTPCNTLGQFHGTWALPAKSVYLPRRSPKNLDTLSKPALIKAVRGDFEIIIDASSCPKNRRSRHRHLSPLAIEIYDGNQPLILNLSPPDADTLLEKPEYRESAFHSMPVLEGLELGTFRSDGCLDADYTVSREIIEPEGAEVQTIICRHNGYLKSVGGLIERRLDIWNDPEHGVVIQGQDSLEFTSEPRTDDPLRLVSVFHLHPDLETMPLQGGGVQVFRKKPSLTWKLVPVGHSGRIATIRSMEHYHTGLNPQKAHTLWMGHSIAQPQNLTRYSNEWALFRPSK